MKYRWCCNVVRIVTVAEAHDRKSRSFPIEIKPRRILTAWWLTSPYNNTSIWLCLHQPSTCWAASHLYRSKVPTSRLYDTVKEPWRYPVEQASSGPHCITFQLRSSNQLSNRILQLRQSLQPGLVRWLALLLFQQLQSIISLIRAQAKCAMEYQATIGSGAVIQRVFKNTLHTRMSCSLYYFTHFSFVYFETCDMLHQYSLCIGPASLTYNLMRHQRHKSRCWRIGSEG